MSTRHTERWADEIENAIRWSEATDDENLIEAAERFVELASQDDTQFQLTAVWTSWVTFMELVDYERMRIR